MQNEQQRVFAASRFQRFRMLFAQVPAHTLRQCNEIDFPFECRQIDVKLLFIDGRLFFDQGPGVVVVELPFGENEFLQQFQWAPNIFVQSNENRTSASDSSDPVQNVRRNKVE